MTKTAIYCRVSSKHQEKEKTIESQIAEIKRICKENNAEIVKEYIDNGFSGESLDRPALDQLRDDAKKGIWQCLYIHSSDRLGRDHIDQGLVLRELKKEGIQVIFKDRPLTEENKLQTDIESLLAEHEKRQFIERSRRGKLHKAKNKGIVGYQPKFGLRYITKYQDKKKERGYYKINKKEAKIVNLMFDLYVKYQGTGAVAKELHRRGIRTRRWRVWTPSRIRVLLQEETYIGNAYFNKLRCIEPKIKKKSYTKRVRSSVELRDKKEWIPIRMPAIVDKAKFDFVQKLLKKTHRDFNEHRGNYLLGGILKCDKCGTRMVGETWKKGKSIYRRYRCADRARKYPIKDYCHSKSAWAEVIESKVWEIIKMSASDPDFAERLLSHYNKKYNNNNLLLERKKELITEKEAIKEKEKSIYDTCEELKKRDINTEELFKRLEDYDKRKKEIDIDLKEIDNRVKQADNRNLIINKIKGSGKQMLRHIDNFDFEDKKRFLRAVLQKLTYNSDTKQIFVKGYIPLEPLKISSDLVGKKELTPVFL